MTALPVLLLTASILLAVLFIATAVAVWHASNRAAKASCHGAADVIVVLGGALGHDDIPGAASRRRMTAAIEAWRLHRTAVLIPSGGAPEGTMPEAERMAVYARSKGVPAERIRAETAARTTLENLVLARKLMGPEQTRIVLVSDPWHLPRALRLARLIGLPVCGTIASGTPPRPAEIVRESLSWWLNVLKSGLWVGLGAAGIPPEDRLRLIP